MTTARTIIRRAMLEIGVLTKTESPSADEANDALDTLNALIDSWSNFNANIYSRTRETFTLTSSGSYLIGAGQTFNTVRPIQVVEAFVSTGGIDYQLVIVNQEAYDSISLKTIAGIPEYLTYNNGYPYGTLTLYPTPISGYTITILSEKAVSGFSTLDTVMSLPNGWERALIKNLATELAPQYRQQVDASLEKAAMESLGAIKLAVVRSRPINAFPQSRAMGNIYNGFYS